MSVPVSEFTYYVMWLSFLTHVLLKGIPES